MKNKLNKNGFSFTFDGFVSILVLIGIIAFISSTSINSTFLSGPVQKQIAVDLLDLSVDTGVLNNYNQTQIENFYSTYLPKQYDYYLEINTYAYNGSFDKTNTRIFGNTTIDFETIEYFQVKKLFLNYNSREIDNYNSAVLRMWLK